MLIFIIGFFGWPYAGRIVRGQTIACASGSSWTPRGCSAPSRAGIIMRS